MSPPRFQLALMGALICGGCQIEEYVLDEGEEGEEDQDTGGSEGETDDADAEEGEAATVRFARPEGSAVRPVPGERQGPQPQLQKTETDGPATPG